MAKARSDALSYFRCPLCHKEFTVTNGSLQCPQRHTYNIARQGYVNFITHPVQNDYTKEMLESRRQVIESGFFKPLLESIKGYLPPTGAVLDAGCGEGSQLAFLLENSTLSGIGIDLSKDGILLAARNYKKEAWAVADLAATPLASERFAVILNLLSPANYVEFQRLLLPEGRLIKVVPGRHYLKELRALLFSKEKREYSNQPTKDLFFDAFPKGTKETLSYTFSLTPELLPHFLSMTPLTWNIPKKTLNSITLDRLPAITLDFTLLMGTKN